MKPKLSLLVIALFSFTTLIAQTTPAPPSNAPDDFFPLMKEYEGGYNQLMKQVSKLTSEAKEKKVSSKELTAATNTFNTMAADYELRLKNSSTVPPEQHYPYKMDMNNRLDKLSAARDHVVNAYVKLLPK